MRFAAEGQPIVPCLILRSFEILSAVCAGINICVPRSGPVGDLPRPFTLVVQNAWRAVFASRR